MRYHEVYNYLFNNHVIKPGAPARSAQRHPDLSVFPRWPHPIPPVRTLLRGRSAGRLQDPRGAQLTSADPVRGLTKAGLAANLPKCQIYKNRVTFLGFDILEEGFQPPEWKVETIVQFSKPTTPKELRRNLGMLNYYRRCIPHAAHLQSPLNQLLCGRTRKRQVPLDWSPEADEAFEASKKALELLLGSSSPLQLLLHISSSNHLLSRSSSHTHQRLQDSRRRSNHLRHGCCHPVY